MSYSAVFLLSIVEWLTIYFLMCLVDSRNKLSAIPFVILTITIAAVTGVTNEFQLPFHTAFIMCVIVIGFKIITKEKLYEIFSDMVIANVIFLVYQVIITILISPIFGDITTNEPVLLGILIISAVLAKLLNRVRSMKFFFEKYYCLNRKMIVLSLICLATLAIMVTHIFDDDKTYFWNYHVEMILLIICYTFSCLVLAISIYRNLKDRRKLILHKEHEAYLQNLNEELLKREHEYKNHLTAILGIAMYRKEEPLQSIIDYSENLLKTNQYSKPVDLVSNNLNIASFISFEKKRGKELGIDFQYYVENPFPDYKVKDFDMIEILANLINNAFEAVIDNPTADKTVFLSMELHSIRIVNSFDPETISSELFQLENNGYSSKGTGRGYGIGNILVLCKQYNINFTNYIDQTSYITELTFS